MSQARRLQLCQNSPEANTNALKPQTLSNIKSALEKTKQILQSTFCFSHSEVKIQT